MSYAHEMLDCPVDPWKRNFNVNDIYGDFAYDQFGKPIILKDSPFKYNDKAKRPVHVGDFHLDEYDTTLFVDRNDVTVNAHGYMLDDIGDGNVINKEGNRLFSSKLLTPEDGELPLPLSIEKWGFNPFDILAFFDEE